MSSKTKGGNGYRVIGTRPIRHDGVDKVIGRAVYGHDVTLPGMLHGAILRSPHAHATIKSIDTSEAEASPGVKAVITARDLPALADKLEDLGEAVVNLRDVSTNVLAAGKALYHGHAIAAVAATTLNAAQEAVKKIKVEYEVHQPVLTVQDALAPDAPLLHPDNKTKSLGGDTEEPSNIASYFQHKKGDIDKGFEEADIIFEREFNTATVHQGYIEPHNVVAQWNADESVIIWCSTQGSFMIQSQVAQLLKMPVSKVRVIPTEIGGGFGGKIQVYIKPVAAVLSKLTGRPVRIVMDRHDVFKATGPTPGSNIKIKLGATNDGKLVAAYAYLAYEAGAFAGSPVGAAGMCVFACYDIPNVQIDGYDILCNKPKTSAYRAPGATNAALGTETIIDEICEKIGIDPLEFRKNNGAKEGVSRADGPIYERIGYIETVEAALAHEHYSAPLGDAPEGKVRGRGVASGFWMNYGGQSSVNINVNGDGTVTLIEGSTDIGGTRTSIAMQAAEVLHLKAEEVRPLVVDTETIGYTDVTGGSRTTFGTGLAAIEAAKDVLCQMKARAAKMLEVDADDIEYSDKVFSCKSDPEKKHTFEEVAAKTGQTGGPVVGSATTSPPSHGPAMATHIADIELDTDTGKIDVIRYTAIQDAGKAIHPSYVEGQMQGGAVQGIGWALSEEYIYDKQGHLLNSSFLDYRIMTTLDIPMIDTVIVEVPAVAHPYGVRGVGEVPIVPPPAAIANALYRAAGVRMEKLPMSPRNVLEAMGKI